MTYTFEGAHAEDAGFAEGTVTLTPTEKSTADSAQYDNFSKEQIDWLEEMLETHDDGNTNLLKQ